MHKYTQQAATLSGHWHTDVSVHHPKYVLGEGLETCTRQGGSWRP